ncbi:MAG: uracil-DNA glycosylase [Pseudomonadota bacterium]
MTTLSLKKKIKFPPQTPSDLPKRLFEAPLDCPLCPRLAAYRKALRAESPDWFNNPVPSFGDETARLLIVGLAPGVRGANRTGRVFTGDFAGELLFNTLRKYGFATGDAGQTPGDTLQLTDCMVTNAVRCVPPQNKPIGPEVNACRQFLEHRIKALPQLTSIVTLGKIAHDSTIRALGGRLKNHPFGHGNTTVLKTYAITASYHCSRYNTNTGRLTETMFESIFASVRRALNT